MSDYVYREDQTEVERHLTFYEWFVDSVRDGYGMCIYEYTNDLACRDRLEEWRDKPEVKAIWDRVEAADAKLRILLLPTKLAMYRNAPESHFWLWGYPAGSLELEADLKSSGAI